MEKSSFNSKHEREKTNKNNFYFKTEKKLLRISFKENQLRENNNFRRTKVRKKRPLIPFVHILYIHVCVIIFINYYYYYHYYHLIVLMWVFIIPLKDKKRWERKQSFGKWSFFAVVAQEWQQQQHQHHHHNQQHQQCPVTNDADQFCVFCIVCVLRVVSTFQPQQQQFVE